MLAIRAVYEGDLRCRVTHGPSGQVFTTDAPADNFGKGAACSPTDLVAAALGSCILTVMGIVAVRHGINLAGTTVDVRKEMRADPVRRIASLAAVVSFPRRFPEDVRALLERAAGRCPVHHNLHPDIAASVEFRYPALQSA